MNPRNHFPGWGWDIAWLTLLGSLSAWWCLSAGAVLGVTFDEPFYLDKGLQAWRSGSNKALMRAGTMPLPVDLQTLPLFLWEQQRGIPWNVYVDLPEILPVARAMNLPFWWLLLGYGMLWGRLLGGPWAGRLTAGFLASDPNLLGHAALATTDIALSAMVLVATYHFLRGRDQPWVWRVLLPGIGFGFALATKASALPYVPLLAGIFGLWHLYEQGRFVGQDRTGFRATLFRYWSVTSQLRRDLAAIIGIGMVTVFAYCGCDWQTEPTFIAWAEGLPPGPLHDGVCFVAKNLCIFTNAGEGLIQQIKHNIRGHHGAYLLGGWYPRAVWYYFPAALTIKLPDATLALLLVVLLTRPRSLASAAGWAVLALLLFSLNTRVQIGIRLVFPLIVFLHVMLAVAVGRWQRRPERLVDEDSALVAAPSRSGWRLAFAGLCLAVTAVEAGLVWPDGVGYANRLSGGSEFSHHLLSDSNSDWGQGLPELKTWWRDHGQPMLKVWYYGTDPAILFHPFLYFPVHALPERSPQVLRQEVGTGYLAVSDTLLRNNPDRRADNLALIDWLNQQPPVDHVATFTIFRFLTDAAGP